MVQITDYLGNVFTLAPPTVARSMAFKKLCVNDLNAIGSELAVLSWIEAINGEKIFPPMTQLELTDIAQRFDTITLNILVEAVVKETEDLMDSVQKKVS